MITTQRTGVGFPPTVPLFTIQLAGTRLIAGFTRQQEEKLISLRKAGRAVAETITSLEEFDGYGNPAFFPYKNKKQIFAKLLDMFGAGSAKENVQRVDLRRPHDYDSSTVYMYQDGNGKVALRPAVTSPFTTEMEKGCMAASSYENTRPKMVAPPSARNSMLPVSFSENYSSAPIGFSVPASTTNTTAPERIIPHALPDDYPATFIGQAVPAFTANTFRPSTYNVEVFGRARNMLPATAAPPFTERAMFPAHWTDNGMAVSSNMYGPPLTTNSCMDLRNAPNVPVGIGQNIRLAMNTPISSNGAVLTGYYPAAFGGLYTAIPAPTYTSDPGKALETSGIISNTRRSTIAPTSTGEATFSMPPLDNNPATLSNLPMRQALSRVQHIETHLGDITMQPASTTSTAPRMDHLATRRVSIFPSSVTPEEQVSIYLAFGPTLTSESWSFGTGTSVDVDTVFDVHENVL